MFTKLDVDEIIQDLQKGNKEYASLNQEKLKEFVDGQNPRIALITCSDSRVIPEYIFNKSIGDIFVVRVAGNVTMDTSIISSLEYAVEHLKVDLLIILGHTNCGAIKATEESSEQNICPLLDEIRQSFSLNNDNCDGSVSSNLSTLSKDDSKKSVSSSISSPVI